MQTELRIELVRILARIDREIAVAEALTTVPADDVLMGATKTLAELREARRDVEARLKAEE
jgi:hypothetical protein